jgi:hypothetical protein
VRLTTDNRTHLVSIFLSVPHAHVAIERLRDQVLEWERKRGCVSLSSAKAGGSECLREAFERYYVQGSEVKSEDDGVHIFK